MNPYFDASKNTATLKQAYDAVQLAADLAKQTKKPMKTSAISTADDAYRFFAEGRYGYAHEHACLSLAYSVGILDERYQQLMNERR